MKSDSDISWFDFYLFLLILVGIVVSYTPQVLFYLASLNPIFISLKYTGLNQRRA